MMIIRTIIIIVIMISIVIMPMIVRLHEYRMFAEDDCDSNHDAHAD